MKPLPLAKTGHFKMEREASNESLGPEPITAIVDATRATQDKTLMNLVKDGDWRDSDSDTDDGEQREAYDFDDGRPTGGKSGRGLPDQPRWDELVREANREAKQAKLSKSASRVKRGEKYNRGTDSANDSQMFEGLQRDSANVPKTSVKRKNERKKKRDLK